MTGDPTAWIYDDGDGPDPYFAALAAGADPVDALKLLADYRPAWWADAACRGMDTDLFFPVRGDKGLTARAICNGCTVTAPCEASAGPVGIWGGLTPSQRRQARKAA